MVWRDDKFYYSTRILKVIAENYTSLYDGLEFRSGQLISNPWALAEYKADFDVALQTIGQGNWTSNLGKFKDYHYFDRLQQIIIADIFGITDYELEGLGFYSIPRLRGYAYFQMVKVLNGEDSNERP